MKNFFYLGRKMREKKGSLELWGSHKVHLKRPDSSTFPRRQVVVAVLPPSRGPPDIKTADRRAYALPTTATYSLPKTIFNSETSAFKPKAFVTYESIIGAHIYTPEKF